MNGGPRSGSCLAAVVGEVGAPPVVTELPVPGLAPGEALVAVEAATLCGTDVHFWSGALPGAPVPYVPGHETAGRIVALGDGGRDAVDGRRLEPGDRVVWTYPHCGRCRWCTGGQPTLCDDTVRYGRARSDIPPGLLGGCAELHVVPVRAEVVRIPDPVPSDLAASAACALRTVMHGWERLGPVGPDDTVLVQGAGAVGLFAVAVAIDRGAGRVLVVGDPPDRLAIATRLGATAVISVDGSDEAARNGWVRSHNDGRLPDVVVQCAGAAAVAEGVELVRPGGRYLGIGGGGRGRPVPADAFAKTVELVTIRGGIGRHYQAAVDFLATRAPSDFAGLLSRPYRLDQVGEALVDMHEQRVVKALVVPSLGLATKPTVP